MKPSKTRLKAPADSLLFLLAVFGWSALLSGLALTAAGQMVADLDLGPCSEASGVLSVVVDSKHLNPVDPLAEIEVGDRLIHWSAKPDWSILRSVQERWLRQGVAIESPFHWESLERGLPTNQPIELAVCHGEKLRTVSFAPGTLRMSVRPTFEQIDLELYESGLQALSSDDWSELESNWMKLANSLMQKARPFHASWVHLRLADTLSAVGRFDAADRFYEQARTSILEEAESSPGVLMAHVFILENWAESHARRGDLINAVSKQDAARRILSSLQPSSLGAAQATEKLATLRMQRGELSSALAALKEALTIRKGLKYQIPYDTLSYSNAEAATLARLGQLDRAESILTGDAERPFDSVSSNGYVRPQVVYNTGTIYALRGDFRSASEMYGKATALFDTSWGSNQAKADTYRQRAIAELAIGDVDLARDLVATSRLLLGEEPPETAQLAMTLGTEAHIAKRMGDLLGARKLINEALAIQETVAPNAVEHIALLQTRAAVEQELGDTERAFEDHILASKIIKSLGLTGPMRAHALYQTAHLSEGLGKAKASHLKSSALKEAIEVPLTIDQLASQGDLIAYSQAATLAGSTDLVKEIPQATTTLKRIFWNSWITEKGNSRIEPHLEVARDRFHPGYTLTLDLSRYAYQQLVPPDGLKILSTAVDTELEEAIHLWMSQPRPAVELSVRAMVIGSAAEIQGFDVWRGRGWTPSENSTHIVPVSMDRLNLDAESERRLRATDAVLSSYMAETSAARLRIHLKAVEPGCAAVFLSFSLRGQIQPIDHIIRLLPVSATGEQPPHCQSSLIEGSNFEAGLRTLLYSEGGASVDAALHIVEVRMGDEDRAGAIFVTKDRDVVTWRPFRTPSNLLGTDGDLSYLIQEAHRTPEGGYLREAADTLIHGLFADDNPAADPDPASQVLTRLRELAGDQPRAKVLVRLVDADNQLLFLPLQLLGAEEDSPLRKLDYVFALEYPNLLAEPECVDSWHLAISDILSPEPAFKREEFDELPWLTKLEEKFEDVSRFLTEPRSDSSESRRGEGVILLAHHAQGKVWYQPGDKKLHAGEIRRDFGPHGVAVIASCETSGRHEDDLLLVRRLDRLGVDAVILSPFKMHSRFGKAFALEFAHQLKQARYAAEPVKIYDLFRAAATRVTETLQNSPFSEVFKDMPLELLYAGNHDLTLCREESR